MKPASTIVLTFSLIAIAAACGAGDPQTDQAVEQQSLSLWPTTTTAPTALQEIADGQREADVARLIEAYEHFKRAIAADSLSIMGYLGASGSAQNTADAIAAYRKAAALAPRANETEKLLIEIADKFGFRGDNEGGRAAAEKLVKLDPKNPRSWMLLADIDSTMGQTAASRTEIDKAIEVAPKFAPAYIMASASWVASKPQDLARAEETARKAVELEPNEALAYDVLGDALRLQGKFDDAGQAYTRMAELDPTRGTGFQQRGHVNTFLGKFAEARADYAAGGAAEPGNTKIGYMTYPAFVSLYEGNLRRAYDELEKVYNQVDGFNVPSPVLGKIAVASAQQIIATHGRMIPEILITNTRLRTLRHQDADETGLEENKRAANANDVLDEGLLALARRDYETASRDAAQYMKIREPDHSPTKYWPAHHLAGRIALEQKRYADAVHEFDQSDPNDIYTMYFRAVALEGDGKVEDARKIYRYLSTYYFNPIGLALTRRDILAKVAAIPAGG